MEKEGKINTGKLTDYEGEEQQKKKSTAIASRHIDRYVLFNILTRVPADVLWNNLRYQCKQWSSLISDQSFVNANFHQSKQGIIFMERDEKLRKYTMNFMELKGAEIVGVRTLQDFNRHNVAIQSSCNGLLLTQKHDNSHQVMNPITKKYITLPSECSGPIWWSELVFIPSIMEYKVVQLGYHRPPSTNIVLHIQGLNGYARDIEVPGDYEIYHRSRVCIHGVLYWVSGTRTNSICEYAIIVFDMCTENFQILPIKRLFVQLKLLMNLAGSLSSIEFSRGDYVVNVWTLKDMRGGEWEKLFSFNRLHVWIGEEKYYPLELVGAISEGDWFIFKDCNGRLGAYDVKTRQWSLLKHSNYMKRNCSYFCHQIHVNSLFFLNHKLEDQKS